MCFICWLRSGFSHFINIDYLRFTWYLVAEESRIWKQCGVQDVRQDSALCRCLKTFDDLSESKCSRTRGEMSAGFTNITSITFCTRKFINHVDVKPLRSSIFYIKKILDFESSKDKPYINRFT